MEPVLVPWWPEAAKALNLGRTTMYELIRRGELGEREGWRKALGASGCAQRVREPSPRGGSSGCGNGRPPVGSRPPSPEPEFRRQNGSPYMTLHQGSPTSRDAPGRAVERVLTALRQRGSQVRREGSEWKAQCPAPGHEDRNPSLGVKQGPKGAQVRCWSQQCPRAEILAALGLAESDLFDEPRRSDETWTPRGPAVAVYDYTDENGTLLFQVCRTAGKDFPQRRPDPSSRTGWRWSLGGVRRVPYHLPRLIEGVRAGEAIFVVEGEKDVHALEGAGAVATTAPGGAKKRWSREFDQYFAGATVTVVADRDEPGRKHALDVATCLRETAASVQIVEALAGKDSADHVAAGHGLDRFTPVSSEPEAREPEDNATVHEGRAPSQAALLVRLALERYDLIAGNDGRPYAVAKGGPAIARPLRGRGGLREQLAKIYSDSCSGAVASASAFTDAAAVLEGHASQAEPEPLYLRVAPHGDGVVLDLGTPDGRCVIAGPSGWRPASRSPVLFRRTALTAPLPDPVRGGSLEPLAALLNADKETFRIMVGWLIAALIPWIPHPILALLGEQGTAKSSSARLLMGLIDPSPAPLRSPPRDIRQWAVTAAASWTVCLDNISGFSEWLADSLCKAVTGDGIVDRALYTDDDVMVLAFRRVIAVTSIDAGALRGDLGDRLLPAELARIPDADRRTDEEITTAYNDVRPELLGAMLTLLCDCLAELPDVRLARMPRMADFARLLGALDQVNDWDTLATFEASAAEVAETVVESDLFAEAVRELVTTKDSAAKWQGTAHELHERITPEKAPKWWPRNARAVSGRLRRCAPSLRRVGVEVTFTREATARLIAVECSDSECKLASHRHDRHTKGFDQHKRDDTNGGEHDGNDAKDSVTQDPTLNLGPPTDTCPDCGDPHHRYGPGGRPCRTMPAEAAK